MTRSRMLAWHSCVFLLAASLSSMSHLSAQPTQDARAPAIDLREALRSFYVHELSAELGLSADRASALAPRIDALLDAHRAAARDRVAAGLGLRKAINGARDPISALAALTGAENDGRAGIVAARATVLAQLEPREQARFLAFEEPFRARVRALLTGSGAEGASGAGGIPRGSAPKAPPSIEPEPDKPALPERGSEPKPAKGKGNKEPKEDKEPKKDKPKKDKDPE